MTRTDVRGMSTTRTVGKKGCTPKGSFLAKPSRTGQLWAQRAAVLEPLPSAAGTELPALCAHSCPVLPGLARNGHNGCTNR